MMPVIYAVLMCHFLTAFTALGMPLFMPRMLASLMEGDPEYLTGIMFIVPVLCAALTATWWGLFADKFGKKQSLLRAQLGLIVGFLLSGFADTLWLFCLGLIVQGLCGGTLAASNAYLSSKFKGASLAKSLNMTQLSARLALVSAPVVLGAFTQIESPLDIYRYLAILPCIAFVVCLFLEKDELTTKAKKLSPSSPLSTTSSSSPLSTTASSTADTEEKKEMSQVLLLQFLFCFSMVVTFPYFLPYVQTLATSSDSLVGFYYSLPHLVYILLATSVGKLTLNAHKQTLIGLLILGVSCLGQFLLSSSDGLVIYRLLFGLGMLLSYSGLHLMLSERLQHNKAGLSFGRFDAWGKWGGVLAGLSAGYISQQFSLHWPFLLASIACLLAIIVLVFYRKESLKHVYPTA